MTTDSIISEVWGFCTTLRDGGDYLEQLQDTAKLACVVEMVDDTEWVVLGADTKGAVYEGLLEKNAEDTKSGVGQYFTPRALIKAMVESLRPRPGKTIADPACGTGGFFLAAYDHLVANHALNKAQKAFLKTKPSLGTRLSPTRGDSAR